MPHDPADFPPPDLGQAILDTIARVTGRVVERSSVYAFRGDSIEVTAILLDDGCVRVEMRGTGGTGGVA